MTCSQAQHNSAVFCCGEMPICCSRECQATSAEGEPLQMCATSVLSTGPAIKSNKGEGLKAASW